MKNANTHKNRADFEKLVKELIEIRKSTTSLRKLADKEKKDLEKKARFESQINQANRFVEDVVADLSRNAHDLFRFSFELLKIDQKKQHVHDLLNGQVQPSILVDIIMSNQFNTKAKKM